MGKVDIERPDGPFGYDAEGRAVCPCDYTETGWAYIVFSRDGEPIQCSCEVASPPVDGSKPKPEAAERAARGEGE